MKSGYRGYIGSRPVRGEMTPQHVQNLVVRDYATRNRLPFLLSATEYAMPGCYMMLDTAVASIDDVDGIILFSLFMLPQDETLRLRIYQRVLESKRSVHFALENLAFETERDIDRLEDMFRVDGFATKSVDPALFEPEVTCPICGGPPRSETTPEYSGVTSDVKPWPRVSSFLICRECGLLHKRKTAAWFQDIEHVYADYEAYHQGQGAEQSVRHEEGSQLSPRSALLVQFAKQNVDLPRAGRLLDVGCGNGAFLRSFAAGNQDWELCGVDRSESGADAVRSISDRAQFIAGGPADAPGQYDLISLVHVLEHVPDPISFLYEVSAKLGPGGAVLVDAPSFGENPFDLVVVDHVLHLSAATLREIARRAGFRVRVYDASVIRKEHAALLTLAESATTPPQRHPHSDAADNAVCFLQRLAVWLPQQFAAQEIGVLGTGIAATWTFEQLGTAAACFVDEDPNRIGRLHMGAPVRAPQELSEGMTIFVAQPPTMAQQIAERMSRQFPEQAWISCPSLEELDT